MTVRDASTGPRMWSRSGSTAGIRSWIRRTSPSSARARRAGDRKRGEPVDDPGQQRCDHRGGQRAELRLGQLGAGEGAVGDQQRDGEPDAGDRSAAQHGRPADGRPDPPAAQPGDQARGVTISATGLPTT